MNFKLDNFNELEEYHEQNGEFSNPFVGIF